MTAGRGRDAGRGRVLRLATRGSPLARWQAARVAELLREAGAGPPEVVVVRTTGDALADAPLDRIGGQGVFVKEIQLAVLEGRADLAVHSAKDLPAATPEGLMLAAVPERGDPRDALVGCRLDDLAPGALVATGSVRRRAQLAWLRPDLTFTSLRGNMDRRLEVGEAVGCAVVAAAALERLGHSGRIAEILSPHRLVPQVAQGALAVECRADDDGARRVLVALDQDDAHRAVRAERAFLAELGGGCTLAAGALAEAVPGGLAMTAMLGSRDGRVVLRRRGRGPDPEVLGRELARGLLDGCGGSALLREGSA